MANFKKLVVGESLSETQFYKVEKIAGNQVQLVNENGDQIVVNDDYVNKALASASQFESTEKVTKTRLAEIFFENSRVAMTVMFNKQVDPKKVSENVSSIYDQLGIGMTKQDFEKKIKAVMNIKGDERVMVGRHYGGIDVNGRVSFVDMNVTSGINTRLVDPRTLNYIIVNNVKYQVK